MCLHEVLGSGLWSLVVPVKFNQKFLISKSKLFFVMVLGFVSLGYISLKAPHHSLVNQMLIAMLIWAFPETLQFHLLFSGTTFINAINQADLKTITTVREIRVFIHSLTLSVLLYYGPMLAGVSYLFRGVFHSKFANLQYLSPSLFYHSTSVFLVLHSLIQYSIGLTFVQEREVLNRRISACASVKELKLLLAHSDRIFQISQKFCQYFFFASLIKTFHMLLDLVTNFFYLIDEFHDNLRVSTLVSDYLYCLFPIFLMFYYSQSVSNPRIEVSWDFLFLGCNHT